MLLLFQAENPITGGNISLCVSERGFSFSLSTSAQIVCASCSLNCRAETFCPQAFSQETDQNLESMWRRRPKTKRTGTSSYDLIEPFPLLLISSFILVICVCLNTYTSLFEDQFQF